MDSRTVSTPAIAFALLLGCALAPPFSSNAAAAQSKQLTNNDASASADLARAERALREIQRSRTFVFTRSGIFSSLNKAAAAAHNEVSAGVRHDANSARYQAQIARINAL